QSGRLLWPEHLDFSAPAFSVHLGNNIGDLHWILRLVVVPCHLVLRLYWIRIVSEMGAKLLSPEPQCARVKCSITSASINTPVNRAAPDRSAYLLSRPA